MWHRVALVRTEVSEEHIAANITVKRFCELGTMLAVTSNWSTMRRITTYLGESWHPDDGGATFLRNVGPYKSHIPEDGSLHHPSKWQSLSMEVTPYNLVMEGFNDPYDGPNVGNHRSNYLASSQKTSVSKRSRDIKSCWRMVSVYERSDCSHLGLEGRIKGLGYWQVHQLSTHRFQLFYNSDDLLSVDRPVCCRHKGWFNISYTNRPLKATNVADNQPHLYITALAAQEQHLLPLWMWLWVAQMGENRNVNVLLVWKP
jgi:hypothetical protein